MDILDIKINKNDTIRTASGSVFMQFVMKKLNTLTKSNNASRELAMLSNAHPGQNMNEADKLRLVKKMQEAGITIE